MEVKSLFAHPIGEVMLDYDNAKLVNDVLQAKDNIKLEIEWDCEVTSSFREKELNDKVMCEHVDLLEQVTDAGNNFLHKVGWCNADRNYVPVDWWFNLYENEHWQEAHHHGVHDLCAIYYATPDLTPTAFINPNDYTFHSRYQKTEHLTPFTTVEYRTTPQPGKLVLFPGYMKHRVPAMQQNYDQRRMTLAFNFAINNGNNAVRLQKLLDMSKGV